jgi:hypothetical protein
MNKWIVGIDPGAQGSICGIVEGKPEFFDLPIIEVIENKKKRKKLDLHALASWLRVASDMIDHVYMEKVWVIVPQGKKGVDGAPDEEVQGRSATSIGAQQKLIGQIEGMLVAFAIPYTQVAPITWKKQVLVNMDKSDKKASILRAQQLFPGIQLVRPRCRKQCDGRADAACLAYYGSTIGTVNK